MWAHGLTKGELMSFAWSEDIPISIKTAIRIQGNLAIVIY